MTRLLESAIDRLRKLPEDRQDQMAKLVLEELAEDEKWAESTRKAEGKLGGLVQSILADERAGKCEDLDKNTL